MNSQESSAPNSQFTFHRSEPLTDFPDLSSLCPSDFLRSSFCRAPLVGSAVNLFALYIRGFEVTFYNTLFHEVLVKTKCLN